MSIMLKWYIDSHNVCYEHSMKQDLTVISLFCGAGGMDLGLKNAGLSIAWANDNDKDSVDSYKSNVDENVILDDIKNIKNSDIPHGDIIVGGFPCQGFSVANKFRSSGDKRNKLHTEMLRLVHAKQPKWFVAENVKGILSLDQGGVFKRIFDDFANSGYRVCYEVVNMADHGVPQARQRVIILGTRKDLPEDLNAYHPTKSHSKNPTSGLKRWVSISNALEQLDKYTIDYDLYSSYKIVNRNFTGHRKTDPSKPSPTILARGDGGGGVNATPHPYEPRRLSVMESAIIQTFPATFKFKGSMTSQYRQIGNAVPVLYGEKLGKMFINISSKEKYHDQQETQGSITVCGRRRA